MKSSILYFIIFLFLLPQCSSIKKDSKTSSQKNKINFMAKNSKTETPIKKQIKQKKRKLMSKEELLPKDYYKSKKTKKELEKEFKSHLEKLNQTCEQTEDKKAFFQKQFNSFYTFLKTSLKDPNMDYSFQILFSDITSLFVEITKETEEKSFITLDNFSTYYKLHYGLSENIKIDNYHPWAKTIAQAIKCI